ncbi:2Fe-2S iron-sulfur cluster-binding protein [Vogesella sp. DC21W]|uniref:2Fe-2S iron-sulfur cluster-binding protein n=1 Tax=Vogesella aquatica TaxID=2984206 RepID=A0ABT5J474_9NEIS|nr:2Fe-2S iron-sulfur cluster-binding protein [Vogesella aquatica]MDC7718834.1 2Fe-2S iron-sulfur cluster-binding protein [Vogesella aquatica]
MTRLVFERGGQCIAELEASAGDALIDVARFHDIPLHWRCGQGTCGTCAVRLQHPAQPQQVIVGRKERNVLLRAGLCSASMAASEQWPDAPETVRLACHLSVGDVPWRIVLPDN